MLIFYVLKTNVTKEILQVAAERRKQYGGKVAK
ncbi:MAG: hypothetical protein ACJA11_003212 [Glaciecola sp.]|jgi:hypothetical protein